MKTFTYYSTNIFLTLTRAEILQASHQGQCADDVLELSKKPHIKKQLDIIDAEELKKDLREYGAWDDEQLADHAENLQRFMWLAAGSLKEDM